MIGGRKRSSHNRPWVAKGERARTPGLAKAILACLFICTILPPAFPLTNPGRERDPGELAYQKNSLYHRIFVFRRGSTYSLRFGKRRGALYQSAVDVNNLRQHLLEYTRLCFAGLLYKPEPERVLVVGLGGGVIPREMRHYFPDLLIDVVEIDPEIPKVAERFFGFQPDARLLVHVSDGRMYIKSLLREESPPKYDLIILDAFNSEYIPFHLMTKEFLEELRGVLADDGAVVANVFSDNRLFHAEMKTFLEVFGRCQAFLGSRSVNAMLVSPGPSGVTFTRQEAATLAAALQEKHDFAFDLRRVARRLRPDIRLSPRAMLLTDDRAPVNWLREQPPIVPPVAGDRNQGGSGPD